MLRALHVCMDGRGQMTHKYMFYVNISRGASNGVAGTHVAVLLYYVLSVLCANFPSTCTSQTQNEKKNSAKQNTYYRTSTLKFYGKTFS